MNRQQRRQQHKALPGWAKKSPEAQMAALIRNGITPDDLKQARQEGYTMGCNSAVTQCYAAFCLVLEESLGFDSERVMGLLKAVDEKVIYAFDTVEMCEDVFKRLGFRFRFNETAPEDRIEEAEE